MNRSAFRMLCALSLAAGMGAGCAQHGADGGAGERRTIMYDFGSPRGALEGEAFITREEGRITVQGSSAVLPAGDAFTVWWIIFNNPENCLGRDSPNSITNQICGGPDFSEEQKIRAGTAFGYCDGFVADFGAGDGNGFGNFGCTRSVAQGDFAQDDPTTVMESGLYNPLGAEVHMILRSHGPALVGELEDTQLTTFMGGCQDGEPNAGQCYDPGYFPFVP